MNRTRKRLICAQCERPVRTFKADTSTCLPCAARGQMPWSLLSKSEREQARESMKKVA